MGASGNLQYRKSLSRKSYVRLDVVAGQLRTCQGRKGPSLGMLSWELENRLSRLGSPKP